MKKPSGKGPARKSGDQPTRRVVRVLTEGQLTEPAYLAVLARLFRGVKISVDGEAGSAPMTLVKAAKKEQHKSSRRKKATGPDFDEIWCVFDVDEHPNLQQALQEAQDAGVHTAVSNPCFELWLVLHLQDQTAHIDRHMIQRQARKLGLVDTKSICMEQTDLDINLPNAERRARVLEEQHRRNGSPAGENPSSGMWRLVRAL